MKRKTILSLSILHSLTDWQQCSGHLTDSLDMWQQQAPSARILGADASFGRVAPAKTSCGLSRPSRLHASDRMKSRDSFCSCSDKDASLSHVLIYIMPYAGS